MLFTSMVAVAVAGYGALMLLALSGDKLIFQPHACGYHLKTLESDGLRCVRIPVGTASIAAVYMANPNARYTLLYSHGNGEDIGDDLPFLREFRRAGFAVFAYDYEGYGASEGRPSETAVYRDVEAAYDFLTQKIGVPQQQVIAHGHSLGAAAAIHLASVRPVAGLIADAPFLSAFRVITRAQILPWDEFDNARAIRNVQCPVLVIQGTDDEVIPFWHGQRIYELANAPKQKLWVEGAGHNDVMVVAPGKYLAAMQEFARSIENGQVKLGL
ncbi:MAG TPA: alpha/beta hydrolase [candidate division Zixibacteria bacterium]|nr:alpha/beta hydrolase [candidate division Zixibacteria bacterium]